MKHKSSMQFVTFSPMHDTRFPELAYQKQGNRWRFISTSDGQNVGPLYASKTELLADLDRYAESFGCK